MLVNGADQTYRGSLRCLEEKAKRTNYGKSVSHTKLAVVAQRGQLSQARRVCVSRRSQLTAALRQHARPIVIEDQELAGPFVRLLRARQLRLWGLGEFVANTMSCGIDQSYGANVEAHWYVGRYVLPGNVQKVILKPKPYGAGQLPRHLQA